MSAHATSGAAVGGGHGATALPEPGPRTATGVPTGRLGIWWFLASEIVIFGGLIVTYILFHMRHPEWGQEAQHTITAAGALNTFVLLTSSLTMVLAHAAIGRGKRHHADLYLSATRILGGVFLIVKAFEYGREITEGYTPVSGLFWSFYFAMTGLHALHVLGGIVAMSIIGAWVRVGKNVHRVEYVGMYWHFVDIVWIFLFPLLYLTS
ncbi:MAG: cytochrome c oxidase subunit 3 [Candidatus Latescibacteria bacterium]|nr:cytochrome c oxidase subunit 3 [Candidatus Latescibacterota bacterium]